MEFVYVVVAYLLTLIGIIIRSIPDVVLCFLLVAVGWVIVKAAQYVHRRFHPPSQAQIEVWRRNNAVLESMGKEQSDLAKLGAEERGWELYKRQGPRPPVSVTRPDKLTADVRSGQAPRAPLSREKVRNVRVKRIVGPRVFSMITGETSPIENRQLSLMMANINKLPPPIQHQLMKTRLPVGNLVEMLKQHAAANPSQEITQLFLALDTLRQQDLEK